MKYWILINPCYWKYNKKQKTNFCVMIPHLGHNTCHINRYLGVHYLVNYKWWIFCLLSIFGFYFLGIFFTYSHMLNPFVLNIKGAKTFLLIFSMCLMPWFNKGTFMNTYIHIYNFFINIHCPLIYCHVYVLNNTNIFFIFCILFKILTLKSLNKPILFVNKSTQQACN